MCWAGGEQRQGCQAFNQAGPRDNGWLASPQPAALRVGTRTVWDVGTHPGKKFRVLERSRMNCGLSPGVFTLDRRYEDGKDQCPWEGDLRDKGLKERDEVTVRFSSHNKFDLRSASLGCCSVLKGTAGSKLQTDLMVISHLTLTPEGVAKAPLMVGGQMQVPDPRYELQGYIKY